MVWRILGPLGEELGTIVKEAPGIGGLVAFPLIVIAWGLIGFLGGFFIIKDHPVIGSIMLLTSFGGWIGSMVTASASPDPTTLFKIIVVVFGVFVLLVNPILAAKLLEED